MGLQFGALLGGSVVVETVFAWPGVGWLMIQSIEARDLPVIRAAVMVLAVLIVAINLGVDVLYTVLDPRIRLEARPLGRAPDRPRDARLVLIGAGLVLLIVFTALLLAAVDAATRPVSKTSTAACCHRHGCRGRRPVSNSGPT